jgi:CheY-specific phosphatase CheX
MKADYTTWLSESVPAVLESMCFLTVQGTGETAMATSAEPSWVSGTLSFTGDVAGKFGVSAPADTARVLAANFLGEEEGNVTSDQVDEVMREVSNIICGAVLAQTGLERPFDLTTPTPKAYAASGAGEGETVAQMFHLDEGKFLAWLEVPAC